MKKFSITRRTITIVIVFQLLLTAGLTLIAILYARVELRGAFDTALEGRAMSTLALVALYGDRAVCARIRSYTPAPSSVDPNHQDLFQIRQDNGNFAAQSSQWPNIPSDNKAVAAFQISSSTEFHIALSRFAA